MQTLTPYDGYRFFGYAIPTIQGGQFDARRRQFREINERVAGHGLRYGDHKRRVGDAQAVEDYLCALVEVGAIPYRERYQPRWGEG